MIHLLYILAVVIASFLSGLYFWYRGRYIGVTTAKAYWQDYYRNYFRQNVDPESASYATGLSDGMLRRDFERTKTLMNGSSAVQSMSETEINQLGSF